MTIEEMDILHQKIAEGQEGGCCRSDRVLSKTGRIDRDLAGWEDSGF
jgi:hypothetical protein